MSRRKARELTLQVLFQNDFNPGPAEAVFAMTESQQPPNPDAVSYSLELAAWTQDHQAEIDAIIGQLSEEWAIERMNAVDRNIIRMAIAELRYGRREGSTEDWNNIVLDEAVELAKRFGAAESPKFVNGVLGAYVRRQAT